MKNQTHICMMVDNSYPNDIRVRKQAESLALAGAKITVLCIHKKGQLKNELINGVRVIRLGNNYNTLHKGIQDVVTSFIGVHMIFYLGLKKLLSQHTIDYLHVHDLPLAGTGYHFKKRVKKDLVLDLHENYPEALKIWFTWKSNPLIRLKNWMFMNPYTWKKREEKFCEYYDRIIAVVDEMKDRLVRNYEINPNKITVVSNHETKCFAKSNYDNSAATIIKDGKFSITYVGGFGPHRGLQTAIKALPAIVEFAPNVTLYLVGGGSKDVEKRLKALVTTLKMQRYVVFAGQVPFEHVPHIMQRSNINIIPHVSNEHTDNTIPHKLFQIMMSKSLLLVSSCKPLKRIVEKYRAGLVFEASNANSFAETVKEVYLAEEKFEEHKANAYRAAMDSENWERESRKLLHIYNLTSE